MPIRRIAVLSGLLLALLAVPAVAQPGIPRQLPQWVRDAIEPVELAWTDVWLHALASLDIVKMRPADAVPKASLTAPPAAPWDDIPSAVNAMAPPVVLALPRITDEAVDLPGAVQVPAAANSVTAPNAVSRTVGQPSWIPPQARMVVPMKRPGLPTEVNVPNAGTDVVHPLRVVSAGTLEGARVPRPTTVKAGGILPVEPVVVSQTTGLTAALAGAPEVHTAAASESGIARLLQVALTTPGASSLQAAPVDIEVMTVLNGLRSLVTDGQPSEDECGSWLRERTVSAELLARSVNNVPLTYPLDPVYLPMCAVLWKQLDQNIDKCVHLPPRAQFFMGVYLGMQGREPEANRLLSSITREEQNLTMPLYVAAETMYFAGRAPRTAMWALKRGAEMRGQADEMAWWCLPTAVVCCRWLRDRDLARQELLPYAEDALSSPGSESKWDMAVPALVEGYLFIGEPEKAVDRGEYWLREAVRRKVDTPDVIGKTRLMLGRAYHVAGHPEAAAENFRIAFRAVQPDSDTALDAQSELLRLVRDHPDIGDACLLTPHLQSVQPERLTFHMRSGEEAETTLTIRGNLTLTVIKVSSTVPSVVGTVAETPQCNQSVRIRVKADDQIGARDGVIVLETNDDGNQRVEVPVHIEIKQPIVAQPNEVYFGFMMPGKPQSVSIKLCSSIPFSIQSVHANGAGDVTAEVTRTSDRSYLLVCVMDNPPKAGLVRGTITLVTDTACQAQLSIPYNGCVAASKQGQSSL